MVRVADRAGAPYERAMRLAVLLFLPAIVTGCAGTGGAWPSLAPRPIEKATPGDVTSPMVIASAAPALSTSLTPALTPHPSSPDIADVAARLSTIERDRTELAARVTAQLAETRSAVVARGMKTEGDAWSKAQLEVTRLDRLGSQVSDLYGRLNAIAGTLAEVAANGGEVAGPLKATGQAIGRVRALDAEVNAGLAKAGLTAP